MCSQGCPESFPHLSFRPLSPTYLPTELLLPPCPVKGLYHQNSMCELALQKRVEVILKANGFLQEKNQHSKLRSLSRPPQRWRHLGVASKPDIFSEISQSERTCTRQTFALLQSVIQHGSVLANAGPTFVSKTELVIFLNHRLGHVAFLYPNLPCSPCSPRPLSTPLCLSPSCSAPPPPADPPFPAPQGLTKSIPPRGDFLGPSVID